MGKRTRVEEVEHWTWEFCTALRELKLRHDIYQAYSGTNYVFVYHPGRETPVRVRISDHKPVRKSRNEHGQTVIYAWPDIRVEPGYDSPASAVIELTEFLPIEPPSWCRDRVRAEQAEWERTGQKPPIRNFHATQREERERMEARRDWIAMQGVDLQVLGETARSNWVRKASIALGYLVDTGPKPLSPGKLRRREERAKSRLDSARGAGSYDQPTSRES